MNKKTLLILLGIFVILGIASSYSWWGEYLDLGNISSSNTELNFSVFSESATDKISIAKNGEEEKIISKKEGKWMINNFVADQKEIDDFFETLASLNVESLVSRNPDNYKNLGVTDEDGFMLTLTSNNIDTIFIIGKQGAILSSFYAKAKEGDNVYEVSGALRDKLLQSITAWRDKTVVNIPKESIQKIEIDSQAALLVMTKNEDSWNAKKAGKRAALDEATTNRLLAAFNPLEASGFLSEEEKKEFEEAKDKTIIRVFGDGDENIAIINLFEKDNDWWGQVEGKTIFYKIPPYKLSDILLKDKDIFAAK